MKVLVGKFHKYLLMGVLMAGFAGLLSVSSVRAQGTSQVQIIGIPPVASSPYLGTLEKKFEAGQYRVQMMYSSNSEIPASFVFQLKLSRNGTSLVDITSDPVKYSPGMYTFTSFFDEVTFPKSITDILKGIDSNIKNQVLQGGTIPEGVYRLEIKAIPQGGGSAINAVPGIAVFTVRLPQPPILVSPPNESNVTQTIPTFAWTPVVTGTSAQIDYHLKIVEILDGQTPLQAIDGNRPKADHVLHSQTTYSYTPDNLPLEEGHQYAWQVTATDPNGLVPIQDDGKSKIQTFIYGQSNSGNELAGSLKNLKNITLIPGFATLNSLQNLQAEERANTYVFSGQATLQLQLSDSKPYDVTVNVNQLAIQKNSLTTPVIISGSVSASNVPLPAAFGSYKASVRLKNLKWQLGQGVTVSADIVGPNGKQYPGQGRLSWLQSGLSGTVTATGSAANPVWTFGKDPFKVLVTGFSMSFPDAQLMASGQINLFNGEATVNLPAIGFDPDSIFANVTADLKKPIYPVPNSEALRINLKNVLGHFAFSRKDSKGRYDLHFQGGIGFDYGQDQYCGASATMLLSSANGFKIEDVTSNCSLNLPGIELAGLRMKISNPRIPRLSYNVSTHTWDFAIKLNADLGIPALNGLQLPELKDITISPKGIVFPKLTLDASALQSIPAIPVGDFSISLIKFDMPDFTFPMFGSKQQKDNGWKFALGFKMHWPTKGLPQIPSCLRAHDLTVNGALLKNGAIQGSVKGQLVDNCRVPIGPSDSLVIKNLSGSLGIKLGDKPSVDSKLKLSGALELGAPFKCSGQKGSVTLGNTSLTLRSDGLIEGDIKNLAPGCPLHVGPYTATIHSAGLHFGVKDKKQEAVLSTKATLELTDKESVSGSASVDLTTGKFSALDFKMDHPFDWDVPKDNPVLVFHINSAEIGLKGFMVDGRQQLKLGASKTGVTFDHMVLDLNTMNIKSGKVIIDEGVNFKAGIGPNGGLSFKAVPQATKLDTTSGLMLGINSTIVIDTTGAHISGQAAAALHFAKWNLDTLKASFNQNFALGFKPFGIKRGEMDFYWKNQRIAYADNRGFFPDPNFFGEQFLPARIPMPLQSVAYLQIKENDSLLVTTTKQSDGTYLINTKPGKQLKLVMPALRGNLATAPSLDVTLHDVHINPSTAQIQSGTITANVPAGDSTFNLYHLGIPLKLSQVAYGTDADPNQPATALVLKGELTLFNHSLKGQGGSVIAEIAQDGHLRASVDLSNLNESVPLDGGANRVSLALKSVEGDLDVNLNGTVQPDYDLSLDGGFQINNFDGKPAASTDIQAQLTPHGMTVSASSPTILANAANIDFGPLKLGITQIHGLNLGWSSAQGLSYDVDLDMALTLVPSDGDPFTVPLKNIELKNNVGIIIPQQEANSSSTPALNLPGFDAGAFHFKPIALRLKRDTLNFFAFNPGDLVNLIPHVDFELTFPGFSQTVPALAHASATINNVGFDNGILDGQLEPFTLPNGGVTLPLSSHTGLTIQKIAGNLGKAPDGTQNYDIQISGKLQEPDFFVTPGQTCPEKTFAVRLNKLGGLTGTIDNFTPCGQLVMGPLSLSFGNSQLQFGFSDNKQTLIMQGTATATVKTANTSPVSATGNLKLDVLHGQVLSSNISLNGPFNFYYPTTDSLLKFTVQQAQINSNGFVFSGGGSLNAGGKSVQVMFNNLAFNLSNGTVSNGSVQIQNKIGLEVGFSPLQWAVVDPSSPISVSSGVRFVMPQQITIDKDGLMVNGQSTVAMRYGKESGDNYQVQFHNMLLGLSPVQVTSGSADIDKVEQDGKTTRVAYYDHQGFHIDNILAAVPIPDTLGLPTRDIAYLVLRDGPGKPLNVQSKSIQGGMQLSTSKPVKLVLAGLNHEKPPVVNVTFQNVDINSAFQVTGGQIETDMADNPIDLEPLLQVPLSITAIKYAKNSGKPFELTASLKVQLPASLNDVPVKLNDITLGPNGFKKATIEAGEYSKTLPAQIPQHPIISHDFTADSNFVMSVDGAQITLGSQKEVDLSGEFYSKILVDTVTKKMRRLHFSAGYDITHHKWNFTSNAKQLSDQLGLGNNWLRISVDQLSVISSPSEFAVLLNGQVHSPDLLGSDFAVTLKNLKIGTKGISVDEVNTQTAVPQAVSILGGLDSLQLNKLNVTFKQNVLTLAMGGKMIFLNRDFPFEDLKISSNGDVSIGSGGLEFIGKTPQPLIGKYASLTSLKLIYADKKLKLQAKGEAILPAPMNSKSGFTISVNSDGKFQVDGPSFSMNSDTSGQNKGKKPEWKLGNVGKLVLTDAGLNLDIMHLKNSTFYASANIDVKKVGKSGYNTIQLGKVNDPSQAGFIYKDGHVHWHISNEPRFDFDTPFFTMSITAAQVKESDQFGVKLNASAKLKLSGTDGALSLHDMVIDASGLSDIGNVEGGSFKIMNTVSLTVGQFDYQKGGSVVIPKSSGSLDSKNIKVTDNPEPIKVLEYLNFHGNGPGGKAMAITVPGGLHGSIEQILYYQTPNGELHFSMKNVDLQFGQYAEIKASMNYEHSSNGDFNLTIAGGGHFSFSGGDSGDGTGFVALGKLSSVQNKISFGVFFQLDATIPIVPGVVEVTSLGGGFFYNGTSNDIQQVVSLTNYDPVMDNEPWEGKDQSSYKYIVVFKASTGIAGTQGKYAVNATALVVVTDQFFALDANTTYFNQDGKNGATSIKGGLGVLVTWNNQNTAQNLVTVAATGFIDLNAHDVVKGKVTVDFNAVKNGTAPLVWALTGNGDLSLMGLDAKTDLVISPKGFLLDVNVTGSHNFWVISFKGDFESTVWWLKQKGQLGAYVKVGVSASVLGGLASLEADAKGALIIDNGYLIYAAAHAHITVAFVFDGDMQVWISLHNSKFDGGFGSNDQFDKEIAEARQQAQEMKDQINKTIAAINDAKSTPTLFKMSDAELAHAGQALLKFGNFGRTVYLIAMIANEQKIQQNLPAAFNTVEKMVMARNEFSEKSRLDGLKQTMNDNIDALSSITGDIVTRLEKAKQLSIGLQKKSEQLAIQVETPVRKMNLKWNGNTPPDFDIDQTKAESNSTNLKALKRNIDALDQQYRAAIDTVQSNINRIDEALAAKIVIRPIRDYGQINSLNNSQVFGSTSTGSNNSSGNNSGQVNTSALSLNDLAQKYSATEESIGNFYSYWIDGQWREYYWAGHTLRQLANDSTAILNAISSITPSVSEVGGDKVLKNKMIDVAIDRVFYMGLMDPQTSTAQANQNKDKLDDKMSSENNSALVADFKETGRNLWFDMFYKGLTSLKPAIKSNLDSLTASYTKKYADLTTAHANFTKLEDEVYSTKANMMSTLHGMLDLYARWRRSVMGDSAAVAVEQEKLALEQLMAPPQITNISVHSMHQFYANTLKVSWTSTHSNGAILENSVELLKGSATSVYASNLTSVGDENQQTFYLVKRNLNEKTRNLRVIVRARGPAGNTISRVANVTVSLDANGLYQNENPIITSNNNAMVRDNTPPTKPYVSLAYHTKTSAHFNGSASRNQNGQLVFQNSGMQSITNYYTNDNSEIDFRVSAVDYQSDIAGFEYAVGSQMGGHDIIDWTSAYGKRTMSGQNTSGLTNSGQEITIQGIHMQTGKPYFISVKAINGDSLISRPTNVADGIVFDPTPPSKPGFKPVFTAKSVSVTPVMYGAGAYTIPVESPVEHSPMMEAPNTTHMHARQPEYTVLWNPSSDPESGIYRYEYVVSNSSDSSGVFKDDTKVVYTSSNRVRLSGSELSYKKPTYVYVRAENNAGTFSGTLKIGPFVASDPTSPTGPKVTVKIMPHDMHLYLLQPSVDPETNIKERQYAIGRNNPQGVGVRSWPSVTQNDFSLNIFQAIPLGVWIRAAEGKMVWPGNVPSVGFDINRSGLPVGVPIYIHYRTVNGQSMTSSESVTGPVILDTSPPDAPTVKLTHTMGNILRISLGGVHDGQSGISEVEYAITLANHINATWNPLWTNTGQPDRNRTMSFSRSASYPVTYKYSRLKVGIRITNGNGQQRVVWTYPTSSSTGSSTSGSQITKPVYKTINIRK